ncbi:MAG: 3-dehydroquinate synthase [Saprospiraceae bacterium]|nr:3-dehydroquinate synthase [Saprospiraceae bacterium]MCF8249468.1 3-dehydroquinate synthase [Saprospiraceae bacterium]MCF8310686.1 3-dehydroquinate synthase [Saprospiraceae bacterium]MCF8439483.1 3-dehydroquinate synthase [Saprospiraceae bacterium]
MFILHLNEYDISIGEMGQPLRALIAGGNYTKIAVLVDNNIYRHCLPHFLQNIDFELVVIEVPAGEMHKGLDTCRFIWSEMMRLGLDRRSLLINLGGGVIGDMGGFCAAIYLRGIDFVQVPTTLLSQVDASVGGKLGIDFNGVKNSIGVFQNPKAVLVDPVFLKTLPLSEIRSGFAEVFKHALIADAEQWHNLQKINDLMTVDWADYLAPSLSIKKHIVEEDPTEQGIRKALNFGHTIGHAVESYSISDWGFRISDSEANQAPPDSYRDTNHQSLLHGEAVAIGIICETWLSHKTLGLSEAELAGIVAFVRRFYPQYPLSEQDFPAIFDLMKKDKKNVGGRINFTLLPRIGEARIDQYCEVEMIEESLRFYMQ